MAVLIHAPGADSADLALASALRDRCEQVISGELTRLERRSSLDGADLAEVASALRELAERLLLEPIETTRTAPALVAELFALDAAPTLETRC